MLIKSYQKDNITIPANDFISSSIEVPVIPGYNRTIWYGYLGNSTIGGINSSFCNLFRIYTPTGEDIVEFSIKNFKNETAKVKLFLRMIYIKDSICN